MRQVRLLLTLVSPLGAAACGRVLDSREVPNVEDSGASDGGGSSGSSGSSTSTSSGAMTPSSSSGGSGSSGSISGSSSGSGSSAGSSSASSSGGDAGGCTPGVSQCTGASAVQTCDVMGQWGMPWPCAAGTCGSGMCTGSSTPGTSCQGGGPGLSDCGSGRESCCTSLDVPGGAYFRMFGSPARGVRSTRCDSKANERRFQRHSMPRRRMQFQSCAKGFERTACRLSTRGSPP